ncbi:MAG: hypothetical protein RBG13Loki_1691 [Promethearchaeota archaeon CR_4]|nr:MAG: hypothetical protein RBG13Loki_1691 [Candidatus Lokiarchaeota archaeon CR_4]
MSQNSSLESEPQVVFDADVKKTSKSNKKKGPNLNPIRLRDYNPAITFYPLFFFSIIAALIEHFYGRNLTGTAVSWLQIIWVGGLFVSICIAIFNFPTLKIIGIFLAIVVTILTLVLLYDNHIIT